MKYVIRSYFYNNPAYKIDCWHYRDIPLKHIEYILTGLRKDFPDRDFWVEEWEDE